MERFVKVQKFARAVGMTPLATGCDDRAGVEWTGGTEWLAVYPDSPAPIPVTRMVLTQEYDKDEEGEYRYFRTLFILDSEGGELELKSLSNIQSHGDADAVYIFAEDSAALFVFYDGDGAELARLIRAN